MSAGGAFKLWSGKCAINIIIQIKNIISNNSSLQGVFRLSEKTSSPAPYAVTG